MAIGMRAEKVAEWQERFIRFERSGASIAQFCRDEGISSPSFYVWRRDNASFQTCDGTDETCPDRRNPMITVDEAKAIARLPNIYAVTIHVANGGSFRYRDRKLNAGIEAYLANWTDVDGGDIYPGRNFTSAEADNAARVVILNEKLAEKLYGTSDPIDKEVFIEDVKFQVIGIYHYTASPMGTPTSAGGGDDPKAIIPYQTGKRHLNFWMRRTDLIVNKQTGQWGTKYDESQDLVRIDLKKQAADKPADQFTIAVDNGVLKLMWEDTQYSAQIKS